MSEITSQIFTSSTSIMIENEIRPSPPWLYLLIKILLHKIERTFWKRDWFGVTWCNLFGLDCTNYVYIIVCCLLLEKKKKLGAYAMKRVAAGAHLPTPWLFEPAKRLDDRADYRLDFSSLP